MNWEQALDAMRRGHHVRRRSECKRELVACIDGQPVYDCGVEPTRLAAAWTDRQEPVLVFQGVQSHALFVPDSEHIGAVDWEIAP